MIIKDRQYISIGKVAKILGVSVVTVPELLADYFKEDTQDRNYSNDMLAKNGLPKSKNSEPFKGAYN